MRGDIDRPPIRIGRAHLRRRLKVFFFFFLICLDRRRKILVRTTLWVCGVSISMPLHRRMIYGISKEIFPETRVYSIYFSGFSIGHKIKFILQACANDNMYLMSSIINQMSMPFRVYLFIHVHFEQF